MELQQLKSLLPGIEVIVREYVQLKQNRGILLGLCPLHNEKTPSFKVDPARGKFHCFGCNRGGDVFDFVAALNNVTIGVAARTLAEQYRIEIPGDYDGISETSEIFRINAIAKSGFRRILYKSTDVLRYLLRERMLTKDVVRDFALGFVGNDGDLSGYLRENELLDIGVKAGLLGYDDEKNAFYDRFYNRVMFPIHNEGGKIAGFGGRIFPHGHDGVKYKNSPETAVFKKGSLLYGLLQAKPYIRESQYVVLVEGYFDVLTMWSYGIKNVVASCGTALTPEQAHLLFRYVPSKKVVVLYDGDPSGQKAAVKASDVLEQAGLDAFMVSLTDGEDPASFLISYGAMPLQKQINGAKPSVMVRAENFVRFFNGDIPNKPLIDFVGRITASLNAYANRLKADLHKRELSRILEISPQSFVGSATTQRIRYTLSPSTDLVQTVLSLVKHYNRSNVLSPLLSVDDFSGVGSPFDDILPALLHTRTLTLESVPMEILSEISSQDPFGDEQRAISMARECARRITLLGLKKAMKAAQAAAGNGDAGEIDKVAAIRNKITQMERNGRNGN